MGVHYQVQQRLRHPILIADEYHGRGGLDGDSLKVQSGRPHLQSFQNVGSEHGLARGFRSRIPAIDRCQVIDDPAETVQLLPRHASCVDDGLPGIRTQHFQQLEVPTGYGERGPQLVRDRG